MVYDKKPDHPELVDRGCAQPSTPELTATRAMGRSRSPEPTSGRHDVYGCIGCASHGVLIWGREDRVSPLDGALVALSDSACAAAWHWVQVRRVQQADD